MTTDKAMTAVERLSRMGKVGTTERQLWVAGCVLRDLDACAKNSGLTVEDCQGYMRDAAEAIRTLLTSL
jgi:hypothetical protein